MNIHLIELSNTAIEKQLALEHHLLKNDDRSFVLINKSPPDAIVMGSSQKKEDVLSKGADFSNINIFQRFSSGGCVLLDKNTIMVSFIIAKKDVPIEFYPQSIMDWSGKFYKEALPIANFALKDNDYVIGEKKVGGNAQYIKKDRFVHHTSFLWDIDHDKMNLLCHPIKEPTYRQKRSHKDFLTTLKPHVSKEEFSNCIKAQLEKMFNLHFRQDQIFD